MNSIPSIFKKIHFSKLNTLKKNRDSKIFLGVIIVNYLKNFNFLEYIKNLNKFLTKFSNNSYKIYLFDFSKDIDVTAYFNQNNDNIEIYLFKENVDLMNLLKFINLEIDTDFIFFIDSDYYIKSLDIFEVLKLFTDKNVGGVTFKVDRGKEYLNSYRYVFKNNKNDQSNEFIVEPVNEYALTSFPYDDIFIIKKEILNLIDRNYYKIYKKIDDIKYKYKKDEYEYSKYKEGYLIKNLISKIDLGLLFILNSYFFIVSPYEKIIYKGKNQISDKIKLDDKKNCLWIINYIYFNKANFLKLIKYCIKLLINGFSIGDILNYCKYFNNKNIYKSKNNITKNEFLRKIDSIFKKY